MLNHMTLYNVQIMNMSAHEFSDQQAWMKETTIATEGLQSWKIIPLQIRSSSLCQTGCTLVHLNKEKFWTSRTIWVDFCCCWFGWGPILSKEQIIGHNFTPDLDCKFCLHLKQHSKTSLIVPKDGERVHCGAQIFATWKGTISFSKYRWYVCLELRFCW